jgi:hypothetical protein
MATKSTNAPSIYIAAANEKSAGKSTVMNVLADMLRETSSLVHLFDPDGTNGSFLKRQGTRDDAGNLLRDQDPAVGCVGYDLATDGSRDTFVNCLEVTPKPKVILADNGAKSLENLKKIIDNGEGVSGLLDVIDEQGFKLTLMHVASNLTESTASIRSYMKAFGDRANHVVVLNKHYGSNLAPLNVKSEDIPESDWGKSDFPWWFGHKDPESGEKLGFRTRDELLAMGGVEIAFPAMQPGIYSRLMATNLTFSEAAKSKRFTLAERKNIQTFINEGRAAFMTVKDKLGL